MRAARESKPKDVQFLELEDCSRKTLEKRRELMPELIAERKKGRRAFLVMDRLVVTDTCKPPDGHGIGVSIKPGPPLLAHLYMYCTFSAATLY